MSSRVPDFYLGTHMPHWLGLTDVPLFVSQTRLYRAGPQGMKKFPRALGRWSMDSGGFSEVTDKGGWTITPKEYVRRVRRAYDEIGNMDWSAPMDWMCEPAANKATGLSVREHQDLTIDNAIEIRMLDPELPFIYVLQGWKLADYHRCVDEYYRRGVDLSKEKVVGLGSVCRRQATSEIEEITREIGYGYDLRLHGFGVKKLGMAKYARYLHSADSLAWSTRGRNVGHPCQHTQPGEKPAKAEGNCIHFALAWREELLRTMELAA